MRHKNSHNDIHPTYVRHHFDYSPLLGTLRWAYPTSRRAKRGDIAGAIDDQRRIKIGFFSKDYFAHRLIWVWMTGKWPTKEIDHVNGKPWDNRWANLREATPSENHRNRRKQRNNTTGFKGVTFDKRRGVYIAGIKLNQKRYSAGNCFKTAEEAYEAVKKLALTLHGSWSTY